MFLSFVFMHAHEKEKEEHKFVDVMFSFSVYYFR